MDSKKINLHPSPPQAAGTKAHPSQPEKAPIDLARYYEGSSADIFIKDETNPRIDDPFSEPFEETRKITSVKVSSSTHTLQPQERAAVKTLEMAHLSHMFHMPTQKVVSPSGSLLNAMKGEGGEDQAALYARYAATLADLEKKKIRKKRGWWSRIRSFFKNLLP